jgi:hypothetical protein
MVYDDSSMMRTKRSKLTDNVQKIGIPTTHSMQKPRKPGESRGMDLAPESGLDWHGDISKERHGRQGDERGCGGLLRSGRAGGSGLWRVLESVGSQWRVSAGALEGF